MTRLDCEACDQLLSERDEAEDVADALAYAVGEYFGVDVGEHSNCNDPRREALAIFNGEYVTKRHRLDALLNNLSAAVERRRRLEDIERERKDDFMLLPDPAFNGITLDYCDRRATYFAARKRRQAADQSVLAIASDIADERSEK